LVPPYALDGWSSFKPTELDESTQNLPNNIAAENAVLAAEDAFYKNYQNELNSLSKNKTTGFEWNSLQDLFASWNPLSTTIERNAYIKDRGVGKQKIKKRIHNTK
jgi:hypothetical protein